MNKLKALALILALATLAVALVGADLWFQGQFAEGWMTITCSMFPCFGWIWSMNLLEAEEDKKMFARRFHTELLQGKHDFGPEARHQLIKQLERELMGEAA